MEKFALEKSAVPSYRWGMSAPREQPIPPELQSAITAFFGQPLTPELAASLQTPDQLLAIIPDEGLRNFIALSLMSLGVKLTRPAPLWAVRAAKEFWRTILDIPKTREGKSPTFRAGYFCALLDRNMTEMLAAEQMLSNAIRFSALMPLVHAYIHAKPARIACKFYAGFTHGLRNGLVPAVGPWPIYAAIFVNWQHVSTLKNVNQAMAWLESLMGKQAVGSNDRIIKLFRNIGFRFTDKGGRPKKPRTRSQS